MHGIEENEKVVHGKGGHLSPQWRFPSNRKCWSVRRDTRAEHIRCLVKTYHSSDFSSEDDSFSTESTRHHFVAVAREAQGCYVAAVEVIFSTNLETAPAATVENDVHAFFLLLPFFFLPSLPLSPSLSLTHPSYTHTHTHTHMQMHLMCVIPYQSRHRIAGLVPRKSALSLSPLSCP